MIQEHTGRQTVNWSNPESVRALNTALLVADYGINSNYADILPKGALFPPVPGRADYIHHIADLLQSSNTNGGKDNVPTGRQVVGIDVGTGASCIYPLLAASIYGWRMIATEINSMSIRSARDIVAANELDELIDVRAQEKSDFIFDGVLQPEEVVDFTMCNPPFYPSKEAFQAENARKQRGLSRSRQARRNVSPLPVHLTTFSKSAAGMSNNFGGNEHELWCNGGEVAFVKNMIRESELYRDRCLWFTSLVSRKNNLPKIECIMNMKGTRRNRKKGGRRARSQVEVQAVQHLPMGTGHKSATILMWSFLDEGQRREWGARRLW